MKFYFCETCGKRVTDADVESGQARNKKLKGVYCTDCAVGVMTMETLPVSEEQARKILGKEVTQADAPFSTGGASGKPKRESAAGHLAAVRNPAESSAPIRSKPSTASLNQSKTNSMVIGVGTGLLIALVLGALLFTGGDRSKKETDGKVPAVTGKATANVPIPTPAVARKTMVPPVEVSKTVPPDENNVPPPTESTKESPSTKATEAELAFEKLIKFEGLAPDDRNSRIVAAEEFLKTHGETIVAARARTLITELKKSAEPSQPVVTAERPGPVENVLPDKGAETPKSAEQITQDSAEARKAYAAFKNEFLALLRKHDRVTAAARLEQAKKNSLFKALQNELAQDNKALGWLEETEALALKGLERLRETDDFELQTTRERIHVGKRAAYQITGIKDGRIQVGSKGIETMIAVSDLTPQTNEKLVLLATSDDAAGFLQRAFIEMLSLNGAESSKTAKTAQADLAKARSLGASEADVNYISGMLDASIKSSREAFAEETLVRFEREANAKKWSEAIKIGRLLLDEYTDTAVIQNKADLKDRVDALIRESGPIREYTLTLQEGQPIRELGLASYVGTKDAIMFFNDPTHKSIKGVPGLAPVLHVWQGWLSFVGFAIFANEGGPLPDKTEIIEAKLFLLELDDTSHEQLALFRVLSPWKPDEVSWDFAANKVKWKTPGGDCEEKAAALSQSQGKKKVWCEFDVTESLSKAKKEGKNYGWLLTAYENGNRKNGAGGMMQFAPSSYADDPLARPKLILKVRCPKLPKDNK